MNVNTLPALFRQQADRFGRRIAIRYKKHGLYHDLRWDDYRDMVSACAAALVQQGIEPGERVAILAENRLEWLVADMAILSIGAVNVPLHSPLTAKQAHWQLDNAGAKWLFVSNRAQYDKIQQVRAELPELKGIASFDEAVAPDAIGWSAFLQRGRSARRSLAGELTRRQEQLNPDDLATIIYTSGTTGNPKGVMLTHNNLLSNALAFQHIGNFGPHTVALSWLPYSHIYARTVDIYVPLAVGATLCLAENAETVVVNLAETQPTNLSCVPRFYEKVLNAVQHDDPAVVGKRLRGIFGPNMDFLSSGGAPLPVAVAKAYHQAGLMLLQGYGLTESSPVISFNHRDSFKIESVGRPIPGVEVRIGPDGEVLSRGPHIMKGYWRNEKETAAALIDGWLHTGDLGRLDEDGFLHITGRKKELIVSSTGKKVVPSYIEGLLLADSCIDQVVVTGDNKPYLIALVVPHFGNLKQALSLDLSSPEAVAHDAKVRAELERRVSNALTDVAPCEKVKKIVILPEPFSVEKNELTVSFKLKRDVIEKNHREELDARYQE